MLTRILRTALVLTTIVAVSLTGSWPGGSAHAAATPAEQGMATVRAQDGATHPIDGANMARGEGVLVEYTPEWGFTTHTNQWGAEAALERTDEPTKFRVAAVNSARQDVTASGNTPIPVNGLVLSAGPGGESDPVGFVTEHLHVGDIVTITRPTTVDAATEADAIDPTAESNPVGAPFPGLRGPEQLIVYTPSYGDSTGTNQWGYEVTVRGGVVTALTGADSPIPDDGFVLSGHGEMAAWLAGNAVIGATVTLDGTSVSIHRDISTYLTSAEHEVDTAADAIDHSYDNYVNAPLTDARATLSRARQLLDQARDLADTDDQAALSYVEQAKNVAHDAYYLAMPSRPADARGMWYRPVETSRTEIAATLDRMKSAGMNEVYLETYFRGYTIYPSDVSAAHGLPLQNPAFAGFDPLRVWREESAKRGIALHAWIDGLAVGNTLGDGIGPILTKHPEWAAVDRDHAETGEPHPSPNGFYWLDVSDPVARQYFVDVMIETVSTYGLDGLNIDYMRYPESDDWRKAYNFSVDSRNRFTVAHGIDPMTLSPNTTPEDWATWETFVESEENRLVADLSKRLDEEAPDAVLSAAPENGTEAAKIHQWSDLVDVVIPQAYTRHLPSIHDAVADMDARMKGGQLTYTGIAPLYEHVPVYDSVQQTVAAKDIDAGTTVFSFGQASAPAVDALSKGPWRGTAVPPALRPVAAVKAQMRGVREDIDEVYLPRKGMDPKVAETLHRRLAAMHDELPDAPSKGRLRALDKELEALATSVEQARRRGQMAQPVAVNVLTRIAESRRIVSYAIARDRR